MNPLPGVDQGSVWSRRQVMVVDEDLERCQRLRDLLCRHGVMVHVARTAAQALSTLAQQHPDLILACTRLADASGEALAQRLRWQHPHLPVILLGPASQAQDPLCTYLPSEPSEHELLDVLERHLKRPGAAPAVLLVDDEPRLAKLMRDFLVLHGFTVQTAASGEEALTALEQIAPLAVVLDLLLPGMDGCATLRQIRRRHPRVPVIVASQVDDDEKREELSGLGVHTYLIKPLDFDDLRAHLVQLLDGSLRTDERDAAS